jgi:hypothetical protein
MESYILCRKDSGEFSWKKSVELTSNVQKLINMKIDQAIEIQMANKRKVTLQFLEPFHDIYFFLFKTEKTESEIVVVWIRNLGCTFCKRPHSHDFCNGRESEVPNAKDVHISWLHVSENLEFTYRKEEQILSVLKKGLKVRRHAL